jgi:dsRNA-specific ribonuclease
LENSAAVFNNSFTKEDVKEDFSQDDVDKMNKFDTFCPNDILERRNENKKLTEQYNPKAASSSPTYVLNNLRPGLIYEIIKEEGKPHERIFTAQGINIIKEKFIANIYSSWKILVVLDGSVYEGTGPTKNLAKHAAAYEALKVNFISHVPAVIPLSSTRVSESPVETLVEIET